MRIARANQCLPGFVSNQRRLLSCHLLHIYNHLVGYYATASGSESNQLDSAQLSQAHAYPSTCSSSSHKASFTSPPIQGCDCHEPASISEADSSSGSETTDGVYEVRCGLRRACGWLRLAVSVQPRISKDVRNVPEGAAQRGTPERIDRAILTIRVSFPRSRVPHHP